MQQKWTAEFKTQLSQFIFTKLFFNEVVDLVLSSKITITLLFGFHVSCAGFRTQAKRETAVVSCNDLNANFTSPINNTLYQPCFEIYDTFMSNSLPKSIQLHLIVSCDKWFDRLLQLKSGKSPLKNVPIAQSNDSNLLLSPPRTTVQQE